MSSVERRSERDENIVRRMDTGDARGDQGNGDGDVDIQSWMVMETRFDLDTRYTVVDSVGQGAYGVVCAARDRKRGARWQ